MKYVYGPVPSRRLGQSLGIDPIPFKTCNWNCVYCQLGRSTPITNERRNYFPPDEIVGEVKEVLDAHKPGEIDWVTFVGSGEPTLHSSLGLMIQEIKDLTDIPVAVMTNGSLFFHPEVRQEVKRADAVLPSLDAGTGPLYRRINRSWPELTFEQHVDGLIAFRQEYRGKLWIEVMLLGGINDTKTALSQLALVLSRIGPDEVHLNIPIRPPAESWVKPPDANGLARAEAILGHIAHVVAPVQGVFDLTGCDNVVDAVMHIITRHPMLEEEILDTLKHWQPGQIEQALQELANSGKVQSVIRYGKRFWTSAQAIYKSRARVPNKRPSGS